MLLIARKFLCLIPFCLSSTLLSFYILPKNPVMEEHVLALRDPQTCRRAFRWHMRKLGEQLGLAISNALPTKKVSVETLLKKNATQEIIDAQIVIVTVLRAGLPLFDGLLDVFADAEGGFFVYQRDEKTLQPIFHANLLPDLKDKIVILVDPMIATGGTSLAALQKIYEREPKAVFVAGVIAAEAGINAIHQAYPKAYIYVAAADPELNSKGYIVPGLGDAGDRAFGCKK